MLVSSFLKNRQTRHMFLAGTPSSLILPPSQLSKLRDQSCAEELCEVVYPNFSPLDGAIILSLFSPGSQISTYSYWDTKRSASNSSQEQFWSSTLCIKCTLIRSIFIQSTLSFIKCISWEAHLLQLWVAGQSTLLFQLASSSTAPSEMCSLQSLSWLGREKLSFRVYLPIFSLPCLQFQNT